MPALICVLQGRESHVAIDGMLKQDNRDLKHMYIKGCSRSTFYACDYYNFRYNNYKEVCLLCL